MYDHARINPRNNQPIRYRIGINSINKLFDIHQFFNGDTLKIYGEPFLKTTTDAVVVSGEVVYLYKLDKSRQIRIDFQCSRIIRQYQTLFRVGSR